MAPNLHLIIHNIISVISIILIIGLSLFTYLNGRKKQANITASLLLFAATIFTVTHTIGINIADTNISWWVLMINLIIFMAAALQVHSVLALVGQTHEKKWVIILFYAVATLLIIFFILNPHLFLLKPVSKMYFPNYYVPGTLNIVRIIFLFVIALPYSVFVLLRAYHKSAEPLQKSQYLYWAATVTIAYLIIFIPNFLVYDIQIDPIWGMLFAPVMIVPFLYGAMKYEMMNIKVIAKQAFFFALAVSAVGGIITLFNYSNIWIQQVIPSFPYWITAFISAVLTVTLSIIIWEKLRKNDMLKYEFITTVTHKFRTPLTHIKWSAENISQTKMLPDTREQLSNIVSANAKLVELTDLLVKASELEGDIDGYHSEKMDLSNFVKGIVGSLTKQIQLKQLIVNKEIAPDLFVMGVASKIQFVVQTLIENSISYTHSGGEIVIKTEKVDKNAIFSVTDTGIGIPPNEFPLLFSKFYRATNARLVDTEGMGIGLYMSKQIIERHKGKIWAVSAGEGKGSTFSFSLPIVS